MKITDVRTMILRQNKIEMIGDGSQDTVVIVVETDAGISGVGEVDSAPYVVKTIVDTPASHMACMGLRETPRKVVIFSPFYRREQRLREGK